uniref:Uncharacterized protein n=1 Tax=Arundo donax TaxID=35708 RepID=A0A0A9H6M3_ARUDO
MKFKSIQIVLPVSTTNQFRLISHSIISHDRKHT